MGRKRVVISIGKHSPDDMAEILKDKTITTVRVDDAGEDTKTRFAWNKRGLHLAWFTHLTSLEELVIDADVRHNTLIDLAKMPFKKLSLRLSRKDIEIQGIELTPLARCRNLKELRISTDDIYLDLSPLSESETLKSIDLSHSNIIGVNLPSCQSLEEIYLSHTKIVSRYMMKNWWSSHEKEFLWVEDPGSPSPFGIRAATVYSVVQLDQLLDLSQIQNCTSLRTLDLSSCDRLHSIDLSVLSGTGVKPKVILKHSPIHQYCIDGYGGKVVLPQYDREKNIPTQVDKNGLKIP